MDKYYFHYNSKDGKYYVSKPYPGRKNNKKVNFSTSKGMNALLAANAEELVSPSAFRATNPTTDIPMPQANTFVKVTFPNEQFDIGDNEYNTATSTFVPEFNGVYAFNALIFFSPDNPNVDYQILLSFQVNGLGIDADTEFLGATAPFEGALEVNDILQLNAGDRVEVFAFSTTPGKIRADSRVHFAGARFPSPKQ
ncbi:ABC transporter permease [Priestia megaterium]|uniref:ABC transporter permease n=1 Tax=Priestia megaterium TaxID=1404 RepID=UPI0035B65B98